MAADTWMAVVDMLEGRTFFGAVAIGSAGPADEQGLFDSLIDKCQSYQQGMYVNCKLNHINMK
jgi:hypothetical protein